MEAYLELGMNPNQNLFSKYCQTKKKSAGFTETCQKSHGIKIILREKGWNTHI